MNVLILIDSLRQGGAERSTVVLVHPLRQQGIATTIATLSPERDLDLDGDIEHIVVGTGGSGLSHVRRLLQERRFDLLHTVLIRATRMGQLAAAGTRTPVLTSLVNTTYSPAYRGAYRSAWRTRPHQMVDIAMGRLTHHYHAISETVAEAAIRHRRIPRHRITVVPRGRSRSWLSVRSPALRAATRAGLGLSPDDLLLLNIGRHEPQKGQRHLIEALPYVRASSSRRSHLVIAGREGSMTSLLRRLATEVGDTSILDFRADVRPLLAAADLFVFPSHYEGLGGAVIEAMAAGVPLVVSDIPAMHEATAGNAEYVKPGDPVDIARGVRSLALDPARAARLAQEARARFESHYTIESVAAAMADLYRSVAAGATASAR